MAPGGEELRNGCKSNGVTGGGKRMKRPGENADATTRGLDLGGWFIGAKNDTVVGNPPSPFDP